MRADVAELRTETAQGFVKIEGKVANQTWLLLTSMLAAFGALASLVLRTA